MDKNTDFIEKLVHINRITKEVSGKNFVPDNIPLDVVAIDILYKESTSNNIYVLDTIRPNDPDTVYNRTNCWNEENLFELHSTIIFKDISGGTFTMGESESSYQGPPGGYDAL